MGAMLNCAVEKCLEIERSRVSASLVELVIKDRKGREVDSLAAVRVYASGAHGTWRKRDRIRSAMRWMGRNRKGGPVWRLRPVTNTTRRIELLERSYAGTRDWRSLTKMYMDDVTAGRTTWVARRPTAGIRHQTPHCVDLISSDEHLTILIDNNVRRIALPINHCDLLSHPSDPPPLFSTMGGRLSTQKAPDGLTEATKPPPRRPLLSSRNINSRTIVAPLAAFTMAGLLFVYARTSIRAAKLNAQQKREADGGLINWRAEGLRRQGLIEGPEEKGVLRELKDAAIGKEQLKEKPGEEEVKELRRRINQRS